MFQKYVIPLVAVLGVAFALFTVVRGDRNPPQPAPVSDAPQPVFKTFVAGSGLVEANTENISIGTPLAGIVSKIYVQIGSDVKAGDPLFMIDDRSVRADIATRQAAIQVAEAELGGARYENTLAESLASGSNISFKESQRVRFAMQKAEAQLAQAQADLKFSETDLERLTVRAPVDGQVLQLKVHPGEFAPAAPAAPGQTPLILFGGITPLHVRVDVDEHDAPHVRPEAAATAYLRGNPDVMTPLRFVRFEPYVIPRKSLTGDTTERVDARVLQVIYSFDRGKLPVFVGQQMDVFIETSGDPQSRSASSNPGK